jgi:hypothetical protein
MNKIEWYKTNFSEYFINFYGVVRTFDRCEYMPYKNSIRKVHRKGKILKPIKMNNGYFYIDIANFGKVKRIGVHRLMAQTFLSNQIDDKHVHHIDGNKENNFLFNLEIVNPQVHCSEHNFERIFKNKTGYRCVHEYYNGTYRGSIQRSGKKTIYTKIYNTPKQAYDEVQSLIKKHQDIVAVENINCLD